LVYVFGDVQISMLAEARDLTTGWVLSDWDQLPNLEVSPLIGWTIPHLRV